MMRLLFLIGLLLAPAWAGVVGSSTCLQCHRSARISGHAPMDQALQAPDAIAPLQRQAALTGRDGGWQYDLRQTPAGPVYAVSGNGLQVAVPVRWSFGHGKAGQTYVVEHEGKLFESRMSYYAVLGRLDLTMGAANRQATTLTEAIGRELSAGDVRECFGCHASHGQNGRQWDLQRMTAGVTCENCHGPGAAHTAAVRAGNPKGARIANPGQLTTEEISEFCGQCHRTWAQVVSLKIRGVNNVRFQPYRLANSKCYDAADARISCVACHNPHAAVETKAEAYDARCAACHRAGEQKRCPQARSGCVSCHMPKVELPGTHFRFADHQIRRAKPGDAYPN